MAVASLVLGILSMLGAMTFLLPPVLAVIFGHLALGETKRDPALEGRGMAVAGLVMGYISLALWALGLLIFGMILLFGLFAAAASV